MAGVLLVGKNNGATFGTTGAWADSNQTEEVFNDLTGASTDIGANTVRVPAGTFRISAAQYLWRPGIHGVRLFDATAGAFVAPHMGWSGHPISDETATTYYGMERRLTISGGHVDLKVQYYAVGDVNTLARANISGISGADTWLMVEPIANSGVIIIEGVTNGAAGVAGSWQDRNLDGTMKNTIAGASINAGTNTITLPAGTYSGRMKQSFHNNRDSQTQLFNATDSVEVNPASVTGYTRGGSLQRTTACIVQPIMFSIAATKDFRPRYWTSVNGTLGEVNQSGSTGQDLAIRLIRH